MPAKDPNSTTTPVVCPILYNPPSISARQLHDMLVVAHATGNVARRRFIDGLYTMRETGLYLQLGSKNITSYAEENFRYMCSQVYDFLRVSGRLRDLPGLAQAFELGELSYSLLSELTRVAASETEGEWLEYLEGRRVGAVLAEVRDAKRKNRKRPRKDGYGLPGLPVKIGFELTAEEHAVVERGLEKVASEMAQGLEGARPSPKDALLYVMHRVLQTEPEGTVTGDRVEREESPFTVVFERCPDCRRAAVETDDGRVEVSAEAVDRVERTAACVVVKEPAAAPEAGGAERVPPGERDRPNTPAIRKALRFREGCRCANPYCRVETGTSGHGHHIDLRSKGGPTVLANEVWVCVVCHALLHTGALVVEGDPVRGLAWRTKAADLARAVRKELHEALKTPHLRTVAAGESGGPDDVRGPEVRSAEEGGGHSAAVADALAALLSLGFSQAAARSRLEAVRGRLAPGGSLESLVREALRG